jgi:hypothetical protein
MQFKMQKLALTSLTSGGRLVGIVRSRTKATDVLLLLLLLNGERKPKEGTKRETGKKSAGI